MAHGMRHLQPPGSALASSRRKPVPFSRCRDSQCAQQQRQRSPGERGRAIPIKQDPAENAAARNGAVPGDHIHGQRRIRTFTGGIRQCGLQ
ncbi:Uncharacterised protein [Serratia plymuthica]|nr:Uncharacterised protein [Serratia plymuthica]